jgi:hypothetical protein
MNKNKSIEFLIEAHKSCARDALLSHSTDRIENRIYIGEEDFDLFSKKYNIKFPDEIVYFYSQIGCQENDFTRQIKHNLEMDIKPQILIHFSENFAQLICAEYFKLNDAQRASLSIEIEQLSNGGFQAQTQEAIQYILTEGPLFYEFDEDCFSFTFLNTVYKENYHDSLLIKSLVLWTHCGGCGSIILNTNKKGFNSGEMFGHFLEIENQGKKYEYGSNYWINLEEHHLEEYRDYIEKQVIQSQELKKQQRTKYQIAIASIRRLLHLN